jgi:hypothetical protein
MTLLGATTVGTASTDLIAGTAGTVLIPGTSATILTLLAQVLVLVLAGTAGVTAGTMVGAMAGTTVGTTVGITAGAEVILTSTAHQLGATTSSTTRPMFTTIITLRPSPMVLAD